jgi:hypothetical protein
MSCTASRRFHLHKNSTALHHQQQHARDNPCLQDITTALQQP